MTPTFAAAQARPGCAGADLKFSCTGRNRRDPPSLSPMNVEGLLLRAGARSPGVL
jgi:hypothetical protein